MPRWLLPAGQVSASKRTRPEIHGWLTVLHWLTIAYCGLWHRLKTNGWAPLPETGPAILIANHTCGIDHLILQAGCRRVLGFMIAREYYEWRKISYFCKLVGCIPVNRDGRDLQATRTALRALEAGRVLPIFPEGRVTASSGAVLGEIRPGAAFIAIRAGVPVIPAYIRGTPPTDQIGESLVTPSRSRVTFGPANRPVHVQPASGRRQGRAGRGLSPVQASLARSARPGLAGRSTRSQDARAATHSAQRHSRCGMIRFRSFSHATRATLSPCTPWKRWAVRAGTAALRSGVIESPMGRIAARAWPVNVQNPEYVLDHPPLADGGRVIWDFFPCPSPRKTDRPFSDAMAGCGSSLPGWRDSPSATPA